MAQLGVRQFGPGGESFVSIQEQPLQGWKFLVEIDRIPVAGFSKVTGIDIEFEPLTIREVTEPHTTRQIPGRAKFSNIVLERGLSVGQGSDAIEQWIEDVFAAVAGRNASEVRARAFNISLLSKDGVVRKKWAVLNAWPVKRQVGDLNASSSEIVIHTLEIAHEGVFEV